MTTTAWWACSPWRPWAPAAAAPADGVPPGEWHAYGRTGQGQRYSPLAQITPDNVKSLEMAWQYRTGDMRGRPGDPQETTFEVTPLKVGNRLFFCTPHQSVIALDATTGTEIWRFNPEIQGQLALQHLTCRGLSYQPPAATPCRPPRPPGGGCPAKLFMPTADGRVIALSPDTGKPCAAFGGGKGQIDLWAGMPNLKPGAYYSTSPVVVTSRLIIVGGTVLDNVSTKEQSGVIRAFDINTGALVWAWDSGRPDSSAPLAARPNYTPNSPNSWSISSVDEALGMVYVPLGNQPPDQWGGQRSPAVETYSSSVVALDLATGKVRWNFQTVHHDLWDYDVPAQPSLLDLSINGNRVPALVQPTKQGEIFVLDRRTGTPLLPVTEVPRRKAPRRATTARPRSRSRRCPSTRRR
jgi:quinoprotein glucose dehydrogenase